MHTVNTPHISTYITKGKSVIPVHENCLKLDTSIPRQILTYLRNGWPICKESLKLSLSRHQRLIILLGSSFHSDTLFVLQACGSYLRPSSNNVIKPDAAKDNPSPEHDVKLLIYAIKRLLWITEHGLR